MDYKDIIAKHISENLKIDKQDVIELLEIPPREEMGDFAFPCFQLAKTLRKAPNLIAEDIKNSIDIRELDRVEVKGPYVNFFLKKEVFIADTVNEILKEREDYGKSNTGKGKNVLVEYSSPNIAKPFHVGHLSSTVIGNSLSKLYAFEGFNTNSLNHLGDWGTQFGKLITAYEYWVDEEALKENAIEELLRIYVKFHDEAEEKPELEDEARSHFKKLEEGNEYEVKLWKKFRDLSLKVFEEVYDTLGVSFDSYAGESFYQDKMDEIVDILEEKDLLVESNGAKVVMLDEYDMPPTLIRKADGATIYATRDLAAAIYRYRTYDFYKNIYVVGNSQSLHFQQIFKTLELMDMPFAKDCVHVGFGLVKFPDKKLSTRKGDVILLDDLLEEAVITSKDLIEEKNPSLENKEEVSKKVGIGAIIFAYLKNSREKDIVFNWDEMLSFEGETGPYVQYTYARAKSILRKNPFNEKVEAALLSSNEEFKLAKTLADFNKNVLAAIDRYEPSVVTRYVIEVAKDFNKFYNNCPIMTAEPEVKEARLRLTEATTIVLKSGLALIGVETVEEM